MKYLTKLFFAFLLLVSSMQPLLAEGADASIFLPGQKAKLSELKELLSYISPTLSVQADGEYKAEPDMGEIVIGIEADAPAVSIAQQKASKKVADFIDSLELIGIAPKSIQTLNNTLNPIRDYQKEKQPIISYRASQQVKITLSGEANLPKLAQVIDIASRQELNNINSLHYYMSEEKEKMAKQKAIELASQKALSYAKASLSALGVQYIGIQSININCQSSYPQPMYHARMAMMSNGDAASEGKAGATNLQAGESTITANVSLNVLFAPTAK